MFMYQIQVIQIVTALIMIITYAKVCGGPKNVSSSSTSRCE
jgi:hypothetical protein